MLSRSADLVLDDKNRRFDQSSARSSVTVARGCIDLTCMKDFLAADTLADVN